MYDSSLAKPAKFVVISTGSSDRRNIAICARHELCSVRTSEAESKETDSTAAKSGSSCAGDGLRSWTRKRELTRLRSHPSPRRAFMRPQRLPGAGATCRERVRTIQTRWSQPRPRRCAHLKAAVTNALLSVLVVIKPRKTRCRGRRAPPSSSSSCSYRQPGHICPLLAVTAISSRRRYAPSDDMQTYLQLLTRRTQRSG